MPKNGKPDRKQILFDFLFGDEALTLSRLSAGISEILENASALAEDAAVLAAAKRYERAEFLAATAQEEVGKLYIILDMARVDFRRGQAALHYLCRAFYNHVLKHVYFDLSANDYAGIQSLASLQHYFRVQQTEWWPAPDEAGEPDMPNDVFFLREANLYVDVDDYAATWSAPKTPAKALRFEEPLFLTPIGKAQAAINKLKRTKQMGLFESAPIGVFNRGMRQLVITAHTSMSDLRESYKRVGQDLARECGISAEDFDASELPSWPMYWIRPAS
jgi:AbiV family abortive infection protein